MKKLTRTELENAVFGDVDPTTPAGSWRSETLENLLILNDEGALPEEVIQMFRQLWQRTKGSR